MHYCVYFKPPEGFKAHVQAAGCYFLCNKKLLLLKRHADRPEGGTWGVPAGKLEQGENALQAVIREVYEEIGLEIEEDIAVIGKAYVQLPHIGYIFHMFYKHLDVYPELILALDEHIEARWVSFEEAVALPLISGGKEALIFFQERLKAITGLISED